MRSVTNYYVLAVISVVLSVGANGQTTLPISADDTPTRVAFEAAVNSYAVSRREKAAAAPVLSAEATPAQLAERKETMIQHIRGLRQGAKKGEFFRPAVSQMFVRIIRAHYTPAELAEIKAENLEADVKGVRLAVNALYPEGREKIEMPPRLLTVLPQLPDELNYHFVGRNLVLLDKESGLIIDVMTNALP
jgi:hypothetical protein